MLERLRIQNFKSWQDTGDMAFGSLTGFFGTNSSGKSSILQFLLMLKQTVESSDRSRVLSLGDEKTYIDLGTLYDIIYRQSNSKEIKFSLTWESFDAFLIPSNSEGTKDNSDFFYGQMKFSSEIKRINDHIILDNFTYKVLDIEAGIKRVTSNDYYPKYEAISKGFELIQNERFLHFSDLKPVKCYDFSIAFRHNYSNLDFTRALAYEFEQLFNITYYLGPLREFPSRLYTWSGDQTSGVGNRGERAIAALLASRNQGPIDMGEGQPKRTVEEHVAHWLKELGLIYSFKVQPIAPNRKEYEVRIQRTAESASVFLTDVGFGVSQILPVLVLLFYVPEGSTVILEQPEIHLHPAVQAGLADVFIDAIKRRKVQIILESHSEHLLQRLQRRIAEEVISQEEIKLYFTSIEEGRSKLTTLELDEYGNINNWPAGFFGDTMGEAAAMMRAEMERRMRQQPS